LGLSVVHGIIKRHRGVIAVDSTPGQGTRFRLFFPCADTVACVGESIEDSSVWREHASVLVVDDEPALVKLYEIALTKRGYRVTSFTNAIDALECFRAQPAAFDVLIVDQDMPEITGMELSREILKIRAEQPIILITGYDADVMEEPVTTVGIRHWFMKPLNTADLMQTIRKILAEKPQL
jgi:DNA-binding NtrC family response regulator